MKVRKKQKEPTAMEQRNTAITTFILVALVPLFLAILLGFSLKETKERNADNLQAEIDKLHEDVERVKTEQADYQKSVHQLQRVFGKADSLQLKFKKEKVEELKSVLDDAESEIAFRNWNRDLKDLFDEYRHQLSRVERPLNFEDYPELEALLAEGKAWLKDYSKAKEAELFAMMLEKKHQLSMDTQSDLQLQLQELTNDLAAKDLEIRLLNQQLQLLGMNANQSAGASKDNSAALQKELGIALQKAKDAQSMISKEVDKIKDEIIPELKGQRFFKLKDNKEEVQKLKDDLENRVDGIQRALIKLE